VVLAKQRASLDVITGGRLIFGMGVGYLEPEMTAVGVSMNRRGGRATEYLAAMRALWEQEHPAFEGKFVRFAGINAYPRPVQHPLPVVTGGYTRAVHRRAARHADGWYGFFLDTERAAEQIADVRECLAEAGRPESEFEITVTPKGRIDAESVAAYERLGVDRLVLVPCGAAPSVDEVEEFVRAHAPERLGAAIPSPPS
jgi:alkanesulfonate monooxygenase SsuD/methylene tetrahydromethanopterin reductase-like flavin-dependent oxidoreductase (luciferase family)